MVHSFVYIFFEKDIRYTVNTVMSFFSDDIELSPKDFNEDDILFLKHDQCCVVLFYVPWCPYCKAIRGLWDELATKMTFFKVKSINCEKYKEFSNMYREEMEGFRGFPTIVFYKSGSPQEIYREPRDLKHLLDACYRICSQ